MTAVAAFVGVALVGAMVTDVYGLVRDWTASEVVKRMDDAPDLPVGRGGPQLPMCGSVGSNESVNAGWGPERRTFSEKAPADGPVMNSLTDNSVFGDERMFFSVKPVTFEEAGGWCNSIRAEDGELLLFRVYVTNSAGYGTAQERVDRHAEGVRLTVAVAQQRASLMSMTAYIDASNTDPSTIWSNLEVSATQPFRLDVIDSSVTVYSNASRDNGPVGRPIGGAIFEHDGQLLGFEADNGLLAPDYSENLYITFKARVTFVST